MTKHENAYFFFTAEYVYTLTRRTKLKLTNLLAFFPHQKSQSHKCVSWDTRKGRCLVLSTEGWICVWDVFKMKISLCRSFAGPLVHGWLWNTSSWVRAHRVPLQPPDLLLCAGGETMQSFTTELWNKKTNSQAGQRWHSLILPLEQVYNKIWYFCCNLLALFNCIVLWQQLQPGPVCHLLALSVITSLGCATSVISCVAVIIYICRKR